MTALTLQRDYRRVVAKKIAHCYSEESYLFSEIDFEFTPNSVYAVTGPSGSGKSAVLRLLAGWENPLRGSLERIGIHSVSWIFQHPRGTHSRTAEDHITLALLAKGHSHSSACTVARERLALVGLTKAAATPFGQLSTDQRQRLMLARGLASNPDLVLVDEPTAHLDPRAAETVNRTIASLRGSGSIVVVSTRDPLTVDACTDILDLNACEGR